MKKVIIIAVIFIFLLIFLPYAYLALSGGSYDSEDVISGSAVTASRDRYSINTSDRTVDVILNKADIYSLISNETENGIFNELNAIVSQYGLKVKKLGVVIDGTSAELDAKLIFKNFLPIPVRCCGELKENNAKISAEITTVSIGKFINLNLGSLLGSLEDYEFDLHELNPIFDTINSVSFSQDRIKVNIPYPVDWLMSGINTFTSDFTMIVDFVDLEEIDSPASAISSYIDGDPSKIIALIDSCERLDNGLTELKKEILAIGGTVSQSNFFTGKGSESISVLFPELTKEAVRNYYDDTMSSYQALYDERTGILSDAFQYLLEGYADGSIAMKNGVLSYTQENSGTVIASELDFFNGCDWIDTSTIRAVLAKNPGDYSLHQVPKGNTITALILRTRTWRPVIAYRFTSNMFKIRSITENEYLKLMNSRGTQTYDIGEHTTAR